jgi:hypothetical protein
MKKNSFRNKTASNGCQGGGFAFVETSLNKSFQYFLRCHLNEMTYYNDVHQIQTWFLTSLEFHLNNSWNFPLIELKYFSQQVWLSGIHSIQWTTQIMQKKCSTKIHKILSSMLFVS